MVHVVYMTRQYCGQISMNYGVHIILLINALQVHQNTSLNLLLCGFIRYTKSYVFASLAGDCM